MVEREVLGGLKVIAERQKREFLGGNRQGRR
jgi:hypothetical protein